MTISSYSTTPGSNTAISGINIAEGCAPSGINDAIRQLMADLAQYTRDVTASTYIPTVGGTADVITLTSGKSFASYTTGMELSFLSSGASTTNVTVNLDGLGAKAVTKRGATATASNDIQASQLVLIQYDGTRFQLKSMRQVRTSDIEDNQITVAKLPDGVLSADATGRAKMADAFVTNAKLANVNAHTFKGNNTGSAAAPVDMTATQATAELNAMVGDSGSGGTKGLVSAPAAGDAAAAKFYKADGTWAVPSSGGTLGTAQATTSGTSKDFTGIPSTAKRVTLFLNETSLSGSANYLLQAGDGSIVTSGYTSFSNLYTSGGLGGGASSTSGIILRAAAATVVARGRLVLELMDPATNTWNCEGTYSSTTGGIVGQTSGQFSLSGALDRVRLTTDNGTDTFDAGKINISYE